MQYHLEDWSFIKACWAQEPPDRPTITSLLRSCAHAGCYTLDEVSEYTDYPEQPPPPAPIDQPFTIADSPPSSRLSTAVPNTPQLEATYLAPYEEGLEHDVVPSSALPPDVNWLMPNWPFIDDARLEYEVYSPLSLLEQDPTLNYGPYQTELNASASDSSLSSLDSSWSSLSTPSSPEDTREDLPTEPEEIPVNRFVSMVPRLSTIPEGVEDGGS